jgi:cytoskeletal protein CcmA (bactofilin family)
MFGKNKTKGSRVNSFLGEDAVFRGEIQTKGTLRVDGEFDGTLQADTVIVGEKARIKGKIVAKSVIVNGRIEADSIDAKSVTIQTKGQVYGEVRTPNIVIFEGGIFEGKCIKVKESNIEIKSNQKNTPGNQVSNKPSKVGKT